MLRHDALLFLNSQPALRAYAADTNLDVTDDALGWQGVLDRSYYALGLATTDEVVATLEQNFRLLLRYFALEQFADMYAMRVDLQMSTVGFQKKYSQAYNAVTERLKETRALVESLGYVVSGDTAATLGRMTLDFLEPISTSNY